jgi:hypothetical protein
MAVGVVFKLGSFGNFSVFQHDAEPPFLNTEGNKENEEKAGTGIKIRKAGKHENIQLQTPSDQTPTVLDDNIYLFITCDFNRI